MKELEKYIGIFPLKESVLVKKIDWLEEMTADYTKVSEFEVYEYVRNSGYKSYMVGSVNGEGILSFVEFWCEDEDCKKAAEEFVNQVRSGHCRKNLNNYILNVFDGKDFKVY